MKIGTGGQHGMVVEFGNLDSAVWESASVSVIS